MAQFGSLRGFHPGKILLNHWTVIFSMVAGGTFGVLYPMAAKNLSFVGDFYLDLLQIAIIPIMMVALICSFCNIFKSNESVYYIKKIFLWFFILTLLVLSVALLVLFFIKPGSHLEEGQLQMLSGSIASSESALKSVSSLAGGDGFMAYFESSLPTNIIKSIYERNDIAVVVFSVIFGISLGVTKNPNVPVALNFFDAVFSAFLRYVNGLMYALPVGLFFMISTFMSKVGVSSLTSLLDLILCIYISSSVVFLVMAVLISIKSKVPFFNCIKMLKNPYLIAFGTSSSFAAMPAAMLALRDSFKIEKQDIELVLPLGVSIFKPGMMIRSLCVAFFLMNLYHIPITISSMAILIFTSLICSIATTAGPAILSATMFSMVLIPLGIPQAVGVFLLLSVEPVIDPISTVLNVQSNSTVTVLVAKRGVF